ncbi:class F sortase [Glaciihabitans tibetensis]|uniref:class F sortase n=1 Tax=Glaciihabitans tibetensis TaxID=1266600 RepID=UPI001FE38555|nr:class F sortase [Glaciihabitans tibetensis]
MAGTIVGALILGGCSAAPSNDLPETASTGSSGSESRSASTPDSSPPTVAPSTQPVEAAPQVTAPQVTAPQAAAATATRPVGVAPASLTVPAMDLAEPLIPLGIQTDGTMEVPEDYDAVGWFTGGGTPGGFGPTVIAGHVDSRSGPAIFYRLSELEVGDRFSLTGVDGTTFEYEVYKVEDHAKADFPTVDVFGATTTDEVRLITCGGEYNRAIGRYVDNLVVFASRV